MKKIRMKPLRNIKLNRNLRLSIVAIFCFFVVISSYNTYASYQPTTSKKTTITCNYNQDGYFNYIAYLNDNSIYDNSSMLNPGQGNIFRKITDNIIASFSYLFNCDQPIHKIDGYYTVVPKIQTDIWNKTCDEIIPKTAFDSTNFIINFPIDYVYYEDVVTQINNETGINAGQPTLVLRCDVFLSADTNSGDIYESFSSSISVPLGGNIIEINGNLSQSSIGSLMDTNEIVTPGSVEIGNIWFITSIILIVLVVAFIIFTKSESTILNKVEKQVKKIKKKYGEWIVEVEKPPKRPLGADLVSTKTLDDLIKVSEELGKPVIYYFSRSDFNEEHSFFVLDEATQYEYSLKSS